eukprot:gnl/MRDRNA2_/MRDRNA2_61757_c0_seq1.p1 gnl/MRDRNA2_/MRDRNA2_61757_c0~~gnl/MRDRNA2_/MRDRNA2_61757_c0_seq1.p1  ORF type:complete len:406 (+),score=84.35 gnl/MRDRNA2_/MRDRNA2_61757_c0_seq1:180-1220(+)
MEPDSDRMESDEVERLRQENSELKAAVSRLQGPQHRDERLSAPSMWGESAHLQSLPSKVHQVEREHRRNDAQADAAALRQALAEAEEAQVSLDRAARACAGLAKDAISKQKSGRKLSDRDRAVWDPDTWKRWAKWRLEQGNDDSVLDSAGPHPAGMLAGSALTDEALVLCRVEAHAENAEQHMRHMAALSEACVDLCGDVNKNVYDTTTDRTADRLPVGGARLFDPARSDSHQLPHDAEILESSQVEVTPASTQDQYAAQEFYRLLGELDENRKIVQEMHEERDEADAELKTAEHEFQWRLRQLHADCLKKSPGTLQVSRKHLRYLLGGNLRPACFLVLWHHAALR